MYRVKSMISSVLLELEILERDFDDGLFGDIWREADGYWQEGTDVTELTVESIAEMQNKKQQQRNCLFEYRSYLKDKTRFFTEECPGRFASYWDPQRGLANLRDDLHMFGFCSKIDGQCDGCLHNVPVWSREEYIRRGAYAFGLFEVPAFFEAIKEAVARPGPAPVVSEGPGLPRGGVSLHPLLDRCIYDCFFAFVYVNSMWTERIFNVAKESVFVAGASVISNAKNTIRSLLMHQASTSRPI